MTDNNLLILLQYAERSKKVTRAGIPSFLPFSPSHNVDTRYMGIMAVHSSATAMIAQEPITTIPTMAVTPPPMLSQFPSPEATFNTNLTLQLMDQYQDMVLLLPMQLTMMTMMPTMMSMQVPKMQMLPATTPSIKTTLSQCTKIPKYKSQPTNPTTNWTMPVPISY